MLSDAHSLHQPIKLRGRRRNIRPNLDPTPLIKSKADSETAPVTPGSRPEVGGSSRFVGESWLLKLEPRL